MARRERRCLEILDLVRIPEARNRMTQYPARTFRRHAPARNDRDGDGLCGPDLLIADEPTTALDVTVQAQILEIMRDLKKELKTSIVMISHDMGVIAGIADTVTVMRNGEIVEIGSVDDIFYRCRHHYTQHPPRRDPANRPTSLPGMRVQTEAEAACELL